MTYLLRNSATAKFFISEPHGVNTREKMCYQQKQLLLKLQKKVLKLTGSPASPLAPGGPEWPWIP